MRLFVEHKIIRCFIISICATFACYASTAQLQADFKADVVAGCSPVLVKFTDLSVGNPTSWYWDLGNGNISFQQNPSTLYFQAGSYNIKLVVKNSAGADSIVKNNFINISNDPEVIFSVDHNIGCVPFKVQFTDQSNAGFGNIVKWEWDFGDGTTSNLQSPTHLYEVSGDLIVTLKVTNSSGCSKVLRKASLLHISPSPVADFTTTSQQSCNPPATVNFSNNSSGLFTNSTWNFGDGDTSNQSDPSHTYASSGNFAVQLIVSTLTGCADTVNKEVVIGAVTPNFSVADSVCEGAPVTIKNTSSPSTISSLWYFGDGTSSTKVEPVKTYATSGNFQITLINNFGACVDSVKKEIYVIPNPTVDWQVSLPGNPCQLPVKAGFTTSAAPGSSFFWDFGDGATSGSSNPNHNYSAFGNYNVSLTVTSANGCSITKTRQNAISLVPPAIQSLTGLPYQGCLPHTQNFDAVIASPEPVTNYLWNFGDGTSSTLPTPSHTYSKEGTYQVTLSIKTLNGCRDTLAFPAAVVVSEKPVAAFEALPTVSCAYQSVNFKSVSTGNVNNQFWYFGDGTYSDVAAPSHHYTDTGYFTITLVAGNLFCYDTLVTENYVYIKPPVARYDVLYDCLKPYERTFSNRAIAAETFAWDFGDGSTSTEVSPIHTYATPGSYKVNLHVTNSDCYDDLPLTIRVIDEKPGLDIDNLVTCKNTISLFTATNIHPENISNYYWNFGDSTAGQITRSPTVSYPYFRSGEYQPYLTITDLLGCKRTVEQTLLTTINGPTAGFKNPVGACINSTVKFTDASTPFGQYPIDKWIVLYGDGASDTSDVKPAFSHEYTKAGTYKITWIVHDTYGCFDSLIVPEALIITDPLAQFQVKDTIKCSNSPVAIANTSEGLALSYRWNFGDGTTSTSANPVHKYAEDGSYSISLKVIDKFGCTSTYTAPDSLLISNAKALFAVSDSLILCPPAQISFVNKSQHASSITWDFDDGGFSNVDQPSHYYSNIDEYHVKLIAYGYGKCSDTAEQVIVVTGPSGSISYSPVLHCVPAIVNFNADVVNTQKFVWDFGDGTTNSTTSGKVTHTYNQIGNFSPKLLLIDSTVNCTVSVMGDSIIKVSGAKAYIQQHPALFCDSAFVQFNDSSSVLADRITSYQWNFGDGTQSVLANPAHGYHAAGSYKVQLTIETQSGCVDTSYSSVVNVMASPEVNVTATPAGCIGQPVTFSASLVSGETENVNWTWDFGNGIVSDTISPAPQTYNTPGTYAVHVVVANLNGCADAATNQVTIYPLPIVEAGNDTVICQGEQLRLQASGAETYVWSSEAALSCVACSDPFAAPLTGTTVYKVTGFAQGGCKAVDSLRIRTIQPIEIQASLSRDSLCAGELTYLSAHGANNFTWSPAEGLNNANVADPVARPLTTTLYKVVSFSENNCFSDTALVPVTVFPKPVFNIVKDTVNISIGGNAVIATTNSADINKWVWSPTTGLSCTDCASPIAAPALNTKYTATVYNAGGCMAQDVVTVNIFCSKGEVFIPNTFSPNNDGANDVFYPRGRGVALVKRMQVFNRWGNLVFSRNNFSLNDAQAGWNGTYNGQVLNSDVFIYQIEVVCLSNEVYILKGNISLIR